MTDEECAELEYLRWYRANADFGPADGDVQMYMQHEYTRQTGEPVPSEWLAEDGE